MNVLVTGAGLVGCNVARLLAERGHRATLFDRSPNRAYIASVAGDCPLAVGDVQDLSALIETIQNGKIDTIVHTAYLIGDSLSQRPYAGVRANVDGCLALIEAARLTGVKRFLFASTFGVYNWDLAPKAPVDAPIKEDHPLAGEIFYLASKIASERLLVSFAKEYRIEFAILRFAQIYGRGHYLGGDFAGIAMHDALTTALAGKPVKLDPGIITINDHVYAKDVAMGVVLACEKPLKHGVYNIGSGQLSTPAEVAASIIAAVPGSKADILPKAVIGPYWVHEQMLDLTRAREDLGYAPQYNVARGLADFAGELRAQNPARS
ncbi:MAG: NAD(P)-dependent oxidoreductase [Betaproteobacteria bacterium]|nr:NAD(P)-dependent oxidoreductase [Betaproteobacteria bacterium]